MGNECLNIAKKEKCNEFYTYYSTIEKEVPYYKNLLINKVVYCNCDDPYKSKFFQYFIDNFDEYKLRGVVATCYNPEGKGLIGTYNGTLTTIEPLSGNGDFKSEECKEILNKTDIVITNPPFSEANDFFRLMIDHNKQFLILGNQNNITNKLMFPYFMNGEFKVGVSIDGGGTVFEVPDDYGTRTNKLIINENGTKSISVTGVRWFTNMKYQAMKEPVVLTSEYDETIYSHYDNWEAINVDRTKKIPKDYKGVIGVPLTFIDKWNPNLSYEERRVNKDNDTITTDNFVIVGTTAFKNWELQKNSKNPNHGSQFVNGKEIYKRLLIKRIE